MGSRAKPAEKLRASANEQPITLLGSPMRISFRTQYDTYQNDLSRTQAAYIEAQQRLSTGKRIGKPSDDAAGTLFSVRARSLRSAFDQYSKNLGSAEASLKTGESVLSDVQLMSRQARQLAVQGATATLDQNARNAIAEEVAALQKKIVDLGNSQGGNGSYIFAGQRTDTKPFEIANGALVYRGDDANVVVEMSPNETLIASGSGRQMIGETWEALESLRQNLLAGNIADISTTDLPALDTVDDMIGQERGRIGARLQTVEEYKAFHARRQDELTEQISDTEDVDLSQAILDLKQAETAYQAALQSVSMSQGLSLMDFIR